MDMSSKRGGEIITFRKVIDIVKLYGWLVILFAFLQAIPPYTSRGYQIHQWGEVNAFILTHPIKSTFTEIYPIFQVIPLILLIGLFLFGARMMRVFSAYAAISYVLIAILQNVSISDLYGFAVCVANLLTFLVLAGLWFWEANNPQTTTEPTRKQNWNYGVILLALLPFWGPINPNTLGPDFNIRYLFTSGAGLSFCLSTPLFLAILLQVYPNVNKTVFVATGFVGVLMGLGNMVLEFILLPGYWWIGVLHIPLLAISLYCVFLAYKDIAGRAKNPAHG